MKTMTIKKAVEGQYLICNYCVNFKEDETCSKGKRIRQYTMLDGPEEQLCLRKKCDEAKDKMVREDEIAEDIKRAMDSWNNVSYCGSYHRPGPDKDFIEYQKRINREDEKD